MEIENFYSFSNNCPNSELIIKKSKFISKGFYVTSKVDADNIIKNFKQNYSDAKHICFGYKILEDNIYQKSSDDGEPSGTAGRPILNILEKNNMLNALIIVIRYFGGIKLGSSGLLRAYSDSANLSIQFRKKYELGISTTVEVPYENLGAIQNYLHANNIDYNLNDNLITYCTNQSKKINLINFKAIIKETHATYIEGENNDNY